MDKADGTINQLAVPLHVPTVHAETLMQLEQGLVLPNFGGTYPALCNGRIVAITLSMGVAATAVGQVGTDPRLHLKVYKHNLTRGFACIQLLDVHVAPRMVYVNRIPTPSAYVAHVETVTVDIPFCENDRLGICFVPRYDHCDSISDVSELLASMLMTFET